MGFELTQGAVFYIFMMLIVVVLGIGLVAGFRAPSLSKIKQLSETFEPGRIYITNEDNNIQRFARLDCMEQTYKVTLDGVKFAMKKTPNDKNDEFKFMTILDYNNILFVGMIGDGTDVTCRADGEVFECPDNVKIVFDLRGIGKPEGDVPFHFTTWQSNTAMKNSITQTTTIDQLLDSYSEFYLSSFDVPVNVETKCTEDFCSRIKTENECKNSGRGCYWTGIWGRCTICPASSSCPQYTNQQCDQCPWPKEHCKSTILNGCIIK